MTTKGSELNSLLKTLSLLNNNKNNKLLEQWSTLFSETSKWIVCISVYHCALFDLYFHVNIFYCLIHIYVCTRAAAVHPEGLYFFLLSIKNTHRVFYTFEDVAAAAETFLTADSLLPLLVVHTRSTANEKGVRWPSPPDVNNQKTALAEVDQSNREKSSRRHRIGCGRAETVLRGWSVWWSAERKETLNWGGRLHGPDSRCGVQSPVAASRVQVQRPGVRTTGTQVRSDVRSGVCPCSDGRFTNGGLLRWFIKVVWG